MLPESAGPSTEKPGMIDFAVATKSVADDYPAGMFPFR